MTAEEESILVNRHVGNFKTLFRIYQSDSKFYESWYFAIPIVLAVICTTITTVTNTNVYSILNDHLYSIVFAVIPCLLGFNLGAFILIVGFGSTDVLKKITKPLKEQKDYSLYQKLMSILGFSVFIQIATLALNTIFQLISFWDIQLCAYINKFSNWVALFLLIFSFLYSISQLFIVVKHVFLFGQTIHFSIQHAAITEAEENGENI